MKNSYIKKTVGIFIGLASLFVASYFLYSYGKFPQKGSYQTRYGATGIDLRNIWGKKSDPACFPDGECVGFEKDYCEDVRECGNSKECLSSLSGRWVGVDFVKWCDSALSRYTAPLAVQNWCYQAERRLGGVKLPDICDPSNLQEDKIKSFWEKCQKENYSPESLCHLGYKPLGQQLSFNNWPKFSLPEGYSPDEGVDQTMQRLSKDNPNARIDLSPYASNWSMTAPIYNLNRNVSQIHAYLATASLVHRFQGWQQIVYYLNDPQYYDPNLVNDIARWFGINYIFTVPNQYGDSGIFQKAGWEIFRGSWSDGILKFPEENQLTDLSTKQTVLVIGQNKVSAYDQVFTLSLWGILPYKNTLLVWGKGEIDGYSLEELKKFDVLLLQGYTYRSHTKADSLLSEYVKSGGSLFIDTGWQYTVPDWESGKTLDVLPLTKLEWTDLGKTSDYQFEDKTFSEGIDLGAFAPLVYGDGSWGVSTSEGKNLRDWARVVLSSKGKPLVAYGTYGSGRIVWSGMNLYPHAKQKDKIYKEEIKFLNKLFDWLRGDSPVKEYELTYIRPSPDKTEFSIQDNVDQRSWLLWKEGYYPFFNAQQISGNTKTSLKVYRGGPGWALIEIPKASKGDKIIYAYKQPLTETAAGFVSLFSFVVLLLIVAEGFLREKSYLARGTSLVETKLLKLTSIVKKSRTLLTKDSEEENY